MHVGDQAIAQIGDLLRKHLPPNSVAARISGDRFAVVMPSDIDEAAMFGEGLREGVTRLSTAGVDARFRLSISLGVTPFSGRDGDLGRSLAEAESACKAAKDRGRNRLETFQENDVSIIRRFTDINVATDVRAALAENRLRLEAQMIVPFTDDARRQAALRAAAAHARSGRQHHRARPLPVGGAALPDDADHRPLGDLDRHRAAAPAPRAAGERAGGASPSISPASRCTDEEFPDYVIRSIENSRINPAVFCFELTESAAVASMKDAEALMSRLRKLGCGVALDDFGTGLSSLSYLRSMPVSMLKIDGSFVRDILRDERAESMVRAIAQLARAMNITTVAEYVETEEIRTRVRSLGVDYGQGFAIARPVPVQEVLDVLPVLAAATPGRLPDRRAGRAHAGLSVTPLQSELGFAPMKLLALGVVLGFLIALGGAVFAHRDAARRPQRPRGRAAPTAQIAAHAPPKPRNSPKFSNACKREYVDDVSAPRAHRRRAARPGRRTRSLFFLSRRRGICRPARQHRRHLRRHRHRSVDRGSRAARGAAVPRFAGRGRGHPQRRHDFGHRRHARRRRSRCRHGAHARAARLHREARGDARRPDAAARIHGRARAGRRAQRAPWRRSTAAICTRASPRSATRPPRISPPASRACAAISTPSRAASIIDLRNNPGGVLESAVEVADQLLEEGVIVTADGRTPAARFSMEATPGEMLPGVPVVVLVNGATASAAEILAGALQDHHRAVLLGRRTFGKGSVQTVMPLTQGRAIKLTTSRYFTPSGRSIQGRGIDPDHVFENVDGVPLDLDDRARAPARWRTRDARRARRARAAQGAQTQAARRRA